MLLAAHDVGVGAFRAVTKCGAGFTDVGLAMRFPRFTGRWRDDKAAEDATTTRELAELFLTARRTPTGG